VRPVGIPWSCAAGAAAGEAILDYIKTQNLSATGLTVTFDGATSIASVFGVAPDQATKEKIVLCAGNVSGVAQVKDMMSVDKSEPESKFYTVVSGDMRSKISKAQYGDANAYMKIFEANKPMLSHPDKIYPGQVLRIPPKWTVRHLLQICRCARTRAAVVRVRRCGVSPSGGAQEKPPIREPDHDIGPGPGEDDEDAGADERPMRSAQALPRKHPPVKEPPQPTEPPVEEPDESEHPPDGDPKIDDPDEPA
jgi:LysM repeat protein